IQPTTCYEESCRFSQSMLPDPRSGPRSPDVKRDKAVEHHGEVAAGQLQYEPDEERRNERRDLTDGVDDREDAADRFPRHEDQRKREQAGGSDVQKKK